MESPIDEPDLKNEESEKDSLEITCQFCGDGPFKKNLGLQGHIRYKHFKEWEELYPASVPHKTGRPPKEKKRKNPPLKQVADTQPNRKQMEDHIIIDEETKEVKAKEILASKSIKYNGEEAHMAELLINNGFADNISDLNRKTLKLVFNLMKGEMGDFMIGNTPGRGKTPQQILEDIQKQELLDMEIEQLKAKIENKRKEGGKKMDLGEIMVIKMLMEDKANANQQQGNSFTQALQILEVMKTMNPQPQPVTDSFKQNIELFRTMLEGNKNNNNEQVLNYLQKSQESLHQAQMQMHQLSQDNLKNLIQQQMNEINKLSKNVHSGGDLGVEKIAEHIRMIKELSKELNPGETKASVLDYINSIGSSLSPVLTELVKARNAAVTRQERSPHYVSEEQVQGMTPEEQMQLRQKMELRNRRQPHVHAQPARKQSMPEEDTSDDIPDPGPEMGYVG